MQEDAESESICLSKTSQLHASLEGQGFLFSAGILNKHFEGLHMSPHKSRYNYLLKPPEDYLPLRVLCLGGLGGFVVGGIAEAVEREQKRERNKDKRGQ